MEQDKPKVGRPSKYTPELAADICARLAQGRSLRAICRDDNMPDESTVRHWAVTDHEGFFTQYDAARTIGYHSMFDELLEIADDGTNDFAEREGAVALNSEHIQRSRLRIDTRKWYLSKALPKIYGDKLEIESKNFNVTISGDDAEL